MIMRKRGRRTKWKEQDKVRNERKLVRMRIGKEEEMEKKL